MALKDLVITPEERGSRRMIALAWKEHGDWMKAHRKWARQGNTDFADDCLSGANTIEQLIKRMQKELAS